MVFIVSLQTKNDTLRINILIDIQTTLRKGTIPKRFNMSKLEEFRKLFIEAVLSEVK